MKTFYTGSEPATVAVDTIAVFTNAMGSICTKDSAGVVRCAVSSASVTTDIDAALASYTALREPYEVFSSVAQNLNTTPLIINLNNEKDTVAGYSLSGGVITVIESGTYIYNYSVSADGTDGDRATPLGALYIDGVLDMSTESYTYARSVANGEGTGTKAGKLILTAGQTVDLRASIFGDNVVTIPNASNLMLRRST